MAAFLKYLSEALSGWVDDIWGEERDCNYGDMPMIKILILQRLLRSRGL